jgi:large subunit ribosomal protein L15
LPFKRGFTNINKITYKPVNVGSLDNFKSGAEIDPEFLAAEGLLKKASEPVVILGGGDVSVKLTVKAHRFSTSAKQKIEAAGGTVTLIPLN